MILSTAVVSIVLCAPVGAILMNTLGPKFLSKDIDEDEEEDDDEVDESEEEDIIPKRSLREARDVSPL